MSESMTGIIQRTVENQDLAVIRTSAMPEVSFHVPKALKQRSSIPILEQKKKYSRLKFRTLGKLEPEAVQKINLIRHCFKPDVVELPEDAYTVTEGGDTNA